jgi:addiction module RelE/StbE family toxin
VKLRWTRLAIKDLDSAYAWVVADNPGAANRLIDRIEKAARVLRQHPAAGRTGRLEGTRELVVTGTPFVIPYRLRRNTIETLAVIHSARKWPDNL